LSYNVKLVPTLFSILGMLLAYIIYAGKIYVAPVEGEDYYWKYEVERFFNKKWYFDLLYNALIVRPTYEFSRFTGFLDIDRGLLEFFGPSGLIVLLRRTWRTYTVSFQSGLVVYYMTLMIGGVIVGTALIYILSFRVQIDLICIVVFMYYTFITIEDEGEEE
jgi:NADH-quinone oxidoreductase subunit L